MHSCYLPSDAAGHGGVSPARLPQRQRESLPSEPRNAAPASERPAQPSTASRHSTGNSEKLTPELIAECDRVISKTLPACVVFHKPSFLQKLKSATLDTTMVNALLTTAARHSPTLIRRYGGHGGSPVAADHFATKTINLVLQSLDLPELVDVQALCLLVIHEWGCRNAVRAYIYLGQAARMAQMYRICHPWPAPDSEGFLKAESFRRTLWLIYVLDCFLTSSPGRHPALSSLDVADVALPCQDTNFNFGSPTWVRTLSGAPPRDIPDANTPLSEVGEFGHIVLATKAWRNVVEMLTTARFDAFSEEQCLALEAEIDGIRQSLPMHYADKPGQISLHITMGSGFTFAMIHSLLHCASTFIHRRRILQFVTSDNFSVEAWRMTNHAHAVDHILSASHSVISMLTALESGNDKDALLVFPIFMLFSAFTAGSTVAYLYLKGLAPPNVSETAFHLVRETLRFLNDGAESWALVAPWHRHLSVMTKVMGDVNSQNERSRSRENSRAPRQDSPYLRDDASSQPDTNPDAMDYDHGHVPLPSGENRGSEPPMPRRPGVTTINGGSGGESTPATGSPAPPVHIKNDSPEARSPQADLDIDNSATVELTAKELCHAFERQLLELDDVAAFMGGGVIDRER